MIQDCDDDTETFIDLKTLIQRTKPHVISVIESDVYGHKSNNINKKTRFTTEQILHKLHIPGYKIEFPDSWEHHGVARLLVYVSEQVAAVRKPAADSDSDLPSITLDIGLGREKKTSVNLFYREYTGAVSRENSLVSQLDRFTRQIKQWRNLSDSNRDYVILGDTNICLMDDKNLDKNRSELFNILIDFMIEESAVQLIDNYTRSELVNNIVQRSCIDHIITNIPEKCSNPSIDPVGSSDHMSIEIKKFTRELRQKPNKVKKRS